MLTQVLDDDEVTRILAPIQRVEEVRLAPTQVRIDKDVSQTHEPALGGSAWEGRIRQTVEDRRHAIDIIEEGAHQSIVRLSHGIASGNRGVRDEQAPTAKTEAKAAA